MARSPGNGRGAAFDRAVAWARRPEVLIFLPAVALFGYWLGGERMLLASAIGLPMIYAVSGALGRGARGGEAGWLLSQGDLPHRLQFLAHVDRTIDQVADSGRSTACLVVQFDDCDRLLDRYGRSVQAEVLSRSTDRICSALRQGDVIARLEGGGLAIALAPGRRMGLETLVQIAARLQAQVALPLSVEAAQLYVTCSVGFCALAESPEAGGAALLDAAQIAADEARRNGPGAIRAFAADMARTRADRQARRAELEAALDEGQFRPFFQPQICTDTGALSGVEALARWVHPERGVLPPSEFLTALAEAGLADRLGETMLAQSLAALAKWDRAGLRVPQVGVNVSDAELRDPSFADRVKWELDRLDLAPGRLAVEILETVAARAENDVVVTNIASLSRLGCGIDLDDFGTGHASILNIRRFAVRRLKIDRSFVHAVDKDPEQQRIISAVQSLADRLGIDTLAEGVETPGEQSILAQLGCRHLQGYGIARPMNFDACQDWIRLHQTRVPTPPRIGRKTG
jgi:diguanylate cyclase (GGDEF)-like protein